MKHIKIRSCHMGIILTPKRLISKSQQCVCIHSQIIHYHTGNVSCDVVPNVQTLIFLTKKQIIKITTLVHQFVFHIFHLIAQFSTHGRLLLTDKKIVASVNMILLIDLADFPWKLYFLVFSFSFLLSESSRRIITTCAYYPFSVAIFSKATLT